MIKKEIYQKVAQELDIPVSMVKKIYTQYWRTIAEYMESLNINKDMSEEEFQKLQPNINIPSLGKFYCDINRFKALKRKLNTDV